MKLIRVIKVKKQKPVAKQSKSRYTTPVVIK